MNRLRLTASLAVLMTASTFLIPSAAFAYNKLWNCNPGGWGSSDLPVNYRVNENPPEELNDLDTVRRIFAESFDAWSEPCCSGFAATDVGTTTAIADNNNDSLFVMSFHDDSWPQALGPVGSVLGVTPVALDGRCEILTADVVFNSVGFNFVDGSPRFQSDADLGSIATHEFGHFLGLDHSSIFDATMYAAYTGGTAARSLHQDDIDGVCDIYNRSCSCANDNECVGNEECIDSACQIPPCDSNSDCDAGLECNGSGDCVVPPCNSDDDCVAGQVCDGAGSCVANSQCPICGACGTNSDCGANGICAPAGVLAAGTACTAWCNQPSDCPGDTVCFQIPTQEGTLQLCLNAGAETGNVCPSDYVCGGGVVADPCDGISCPSGQTCNSATGLCSGGNVDTCQICDTCDTADSDACGSDGECLAFQDGPTVCSVPCAADGSCPDNSACFGLAGEDGTNNWCLNTDAATAGICGGDWACESPSALCEGVTCDAGMVCEPSSGQCADEVNVDNPDGTDRNLSGGGEDDGGTVTDCGCTTTPESPVTPWFALSLGLMLGLVRLRRRR